MHGVWLFRRCPNTAPAPPVPNLKTAVNTAPVPPAPNVWILSCWKQRLTPLQCHPYPKFEPFHLENSGYYRSRATPSQSLNHFILKTAVDTAPVPPLPKVWIMLKTAVNAAPVPPASNVWILSCWKQRLTPLQCHPYPKFEPFHLENSGYYRSRATPSQSLNHFILKTAVDTAPVPPLPKVWIMLKTAVNAAPVPPAPNVWILSCWKQRLTRLQCHPTPFLFLPTFRGRWHGR